LRQRRGGEEFGLQHEHLIAPKRITSTGSQQARMMLR
jgi:hypothetical protein